MLTYYQNFIHKSRYSRWVGTHRENWEETIKRYIEYMYSKTNIDIPWKTIEQYILSMKVAPAMRSLLVAGQAAEKDNASMYNCSYLEVNSLSSFTEAMYLLMCGVGVGFSVENRCIKQLPKIPERFNQASEIIRVEDTRAGWCIAFRNLLEALQLGRIPYIDYSLIRPEGTPLKTFGGRASGPGSLRSLFKYVIEKFKKAKTYLTSLECYDIMCKIADSIMCGGARRAALICLFDFDDQSILTCKTDAQYEKNPHRRLANNSIVYYGKNESLRENWEILKKSNSGEPGFFNRLHAMEKTGRTELVGCNPCGEVILLDREFCNLTEVVCREKDTFDSIAKKLEVAAIIGTLQSTFTDFQFLSPQWKANCEAERLLGVSLTGIYDSPYMLNNSDKARMKQIVRDTNLKYSKMLGIEPAKLCTCIKPSGTVSQLVNCSAGIHPRFSQYYIRAVRGPKTDPLYKFMESAGVPSEQDIYDEKMMVLYFPVKSGDSPIVEPLLLDFLGLVKSYTDEYTDHNVSCTAYLKDNEWDTAYNWLSQNFDSLTGITFLPITETIYKQMPFTKCDKKQYEALVKKMPHIIEWQNFIESSDNTHINQEYACKGDSCSL